MSYSVSIREWDSQLLCAIERLLREVGEDFLKSFGLVNICKSKEDLKESIQSLSEWLWNEKVRSHMSLKQLHRESFWGNNLVESELIATEAEVELLAALSILHGAMQAHEFVAIRKEDMP